MSWSISGTTIRLTRGDTFSAKLNILNSDGSDYIPEEGDSIKFAMKRNYHDPCILLEEDIPTDTMLLEIQPKETREFPFGPYVYDIQLSKASGVVDTFITQGKFIIKEKVDQWETDS